jgi:hypothetical protein
MATEYPDLSKKIKLLHAVGAFDAGQLAKALGKSPSTISKLISGATKQLDGDHADIAKKIADLCAENGNYNLNVTPEVFSERDPTVFGLRIGMPRIEIARVLGDPIPSLDAFFAMSGSDANDYEKRLGGLYYIFRTNFRREANDAPYVKGYSRISRVDSILKYEDHWQSESYTGFVLPVHDIFNFISEDKEGGRLKEMFWCGLRAIGSTTFSVLHGYASDVDTKKRAPVAYKILYVRCPTVAQWDDDLARGQFYASTDELAKIFPNYLTYLEGETGPNPFL